jgi:hypothetical protein
MGRGLEVLEGMGELLEVGRPMRTLAWLGAWLKPNSAVMELPS